jgi:hypothetical protein
MDRLARGFTRLLRRRFSRIDYFALYPSIVRAQNADGTLELEPEDSRLAQVPHVPIRLGLPGVTVKVAKGAKVLLGFTRGDPSQPVATLWEAHSLTEITITASVKVVVAAPDVRLGGPAALQPFVLGTAYTTAESTMLATLATALTNLAATVPTPPGAGAMIATAAHATSWAAAATAITAFTAAVPGTLSTIVKGQ